MSEKITFTILQSGFITNWDSKGETAYSLKSIADFWEDFTAHFDYYYCHSSKTDCCKLEDQTHILLEKFSTSNHYAVKGVISELSDGTATFEGTVYQTTEKQYNANELIEFIVNEIRNPIVGLIATSDLFINYGKDLQLDKDEYFQLSRNYATGMSEFVDQILYLIKLDSSEAHEDLHPVCVKSVLESLIDSNQQLLIENDLTIQNHVHNHLICNGSEELIKLAYKQVFLNSILYGNQNRTISLKPFQSDNQQGLVITDYGFGIQPEHADRIFERFYRVKNKGIKTNMDGVGLGLCLVKSISRKLNGKIKICSKPQLGTQFTLTFPKVKQGELSIY